MTASFNARDGAVTALLSVQEQGGYSNIVLEELLKGQTVNAADRAYMTRLVYGVTERRLTIDYCLNKLSSMPVIKMDATIREILRIGVYQLLFMDKTPDFASVHESVELARRRGYARLTGYVNAVLRAVQREGESLLSALPSNDKGLELRTSCPRGWIRYWREAYGEVITNGILSTINEAPPSYIRVNTFVTTKQDLVDELEKHGCTCVPVDGLPHALCVTGLSLSSLSDLPPSVRRGFYFQDAASQWCCAALQAQPGERIADVCASPGGKSFTVAQYMNGQGSIEASDIYPHKCDVIANRSKELGISCVQTACRDASQTPPEEKREQFDRVICDVPCSGLGVIRRKPEIRYKSTDGFDELPALQYRILSQAAALVRPGGVLQYSTCTLRPEENEKVVEAFLQEHPQFVPRILPIPLCFERMGDEPQHMITLFPHIHHSDGFFIAGFTRLDS